MNTIKSTDWDNSSSAYTKLARQGPVLVPCERLLAAMNDASSFSSATAILDIGTGPGTAIDLLINNYGTQISPQARLIASDFSQAMVDATTSRKEMNIAAGKDMENCWSRLEMKVMDAQDLSQVSPDSISHAMGSLVYFMLPDPRKGLLEAHRVLTEGGVFACTSWTMTIEWFQFLVLAAKRVRPDSTFTVDNMMPEPWTNTTGVTTELEAAGFRSVHTEYIAFDWHIDDPERHAEYMVRSSNMRRMILGGFSDFSDEELNKCAEEYVTIAKENNNVCKAIAVLGIGRK